MTLVKEVYHFSSELPADEKFGLKSQICRAAVSIPSNIAEGCSRTSTKDYLRFLEIAMGSAFELETQLILISEINLASEKEATAIIKQLNKLQKMLNSLIGKIKSGG